MQTATLIAWLVTAGGGLVMAGIWMARGGLRQRLDPAQVPGPGSGPIDEGAHPEQDSRLPMWQVFTHAVLALVGLGVFVLYMVSGEESPGYGTAPWIALAFLAVVASFGVAMVRKWHSDRKLLGERRRDPDAPAEQAIPMPVVALHGLAAVTTVVLLVLVALEVPN